MLKHGMCAFARNRRLRTSSRFKSTCAGLANTQLLNHHDPVQVTSFLRLSDTVRLFRGSAAIRPTFTPCVSCLATVSACTLEPFMIRLAFPRPLSFLILFALSFALASGLPDAFLVFFVNEFNVHQVISLHEFETIARFQVLIDCLAHLEKSRMRLTVQLQMGSQWFWRSCHKNGSIDRVNPEVSSCSLTSKLNSSNFVSTSSLSPKLKFITLIKSVFSPSAFCSRVSTRGFDTLRTSFALVLLAPFFSVPLSSAVPGYCRAFAPSLSQLRLLGFASPLGPLLPLTAPSVAYRPSFPRSKSA